jgi:hypothetical protein
MIKERKELCVVGVKTLFRGSNTGLTEWIKKYYKE